MATPTTATRKRGARATVYSVAREAGVTYTTVSNVLNGKGRVSETTRAAVLAAAKSLDYSIDLNAQRLARGCDANTIAFVALFVDFDLVMRKVQTIQSLLQSQGFTTPFHSYGLRAPTPEEEAKLLSEVHRGRPRAIICCGQCTSDKSWRELERYQAEGGHVIFFDQPCAHPYDHVLFDREHNTYEATRYL
jgi:DNA-binding LacI/PurR family transcriptional regulator